MDRNNIIEKIKNLHKLGSKELEYEQVLKKCPEKTEDINRWLSELRAEIQNCKIVLKEELKVLYNADIAGRYLIRITTTGSKGGRPTGWVLQLFHVNGVYLTRKSTPYHEDICYDVMGESFCIVTDEDKNISSVHYIKQTDEFDDCQGYLNSNCFYGIYPDTLNGWKEISSEDYKNVYNKCMTAALNHETLDVQVFEDKQFDIELK